MSLLPIVSHSLKYNKSIDGLRGVAILLVLFFHLFPNQFSFGYVGVDIFFVLSGFLITQIISTKMQNQSFSFIEFYRNRIRRIFPAMIIVLIIAFMIGYLFLFPSELIELSKHIKSSSLFVQNFTLMHEVGYWDTASTLKPILHFWSLSIEEQFYIFWPIIIWLIYRYKLNIITSIGVIFLTLLVLPQLFNIDPFYHSLSRFWELSLGGLAFVALEKYKSIDISKYSGFIVILFFVAIGVAFENHTYSLARTIFITITTALLIAFLSQKPNHKIFSNQILLFFGLISFPLYLWHYMLIGYANIFGYDGLWAKVILALLSILLSYFTYIFVEIRARRQNSLWFAGFLLFVALGIYFMATYIASLGGLQNRNHIKALYVQPTAQTATNSNGVKLVRAILGKDVSIDHIQSNTNKIDKNLVLMIGDSHSYASYGGISEELLRHGYNTLNISNNSSPAFINLTIGSSSKKAIKRLNKNQIIYDVIAQLKPSKVIFNSRVASYITNKDFAKDPTKIYTFYKDGKLLKGDNHSLFMKELDSVFAYFNNKKIELYYMLENPELDFNPDLCAKRAFGIGTTRDCKITLKSYQKRTKAYNDEIYALASKYPKVKVLNPQSAFCDTKYCYAKKDGKILYKDGNHLNIYGSRVQAKELIGEIIGNKK